MLLDDLGRTRATIAQSARTILFRNDMLIYRTCAMIGIGCCNFYLERGIPSNYGSSHCIDFVPALCTHRPSLLPIEWPDECNKMKHPSNIWSVSIYFNDFYHLEEGEVVTRFP